MNRNTRMRTAFAQAIVAVALLSTASAAQAGPIAWGPDVYNPTNIYFGSGGADCTAQSVSATCASLAYTHDLTLHGFVPGASSLDQITGGLLHIVLADDQADTANEALKITLDGLLQPGTHDASQPFVFGDFSGALLLSLQSDGLLNVLVARQNGDFIFDRSIFTAYGQQTESAAVPEPASLFLLGFGGIAAGIRVARRRAQRA